MVPAKSRKSPIVRRLKCSTAAALLALPLASQAQQTPARSVTPTATDDTNGMALETIQVSGNWLGSGLQNSVKRYPGARTAVDKEQIENTGAANIGDVLRRIPGVQSSDNSGTTSSTISLNIGVRGLTGRYSPRSTVLLDGIPLAAAPYGQPQLSFAPVSLNNIESVDVVRGGGAVRYGPQNVGGIINFNTRSIPDEPGLNGDATLRYNHYQNGKSNKQYSTFVGSQLDNGLGLALLYSGSEGSGWRAGSEETVNDFALKFRYALTPTSEIFGKASYYDVKSRAPGGLTVAEYTADPFQNTRPTDFWSGTRKGFDLGYLNTLSNTEEFEIRAYYNESFRQSVLISDANLRNQPRNYEVLGIEPRYTQRFNLGNTTNDVTLGYRYIRERGNDSSFNQAIASGVQTRQITFENATDAHAAYIDDKISFGAWRITPGLRFEHIESTRNDLSARKTFSTANNKALPSLSIAYLLNSDITLFTNYTTSFGPVQNRQINSQTDSNPLTPELAKTIEAGVRWKSKQFSAEMTVFNLRFDNQIQRAPGTLPITFINIGKTRHDGLETALSYAFDKDGKFAGLNLFANYTYTRALQDSGVNRGLDIPFYSRTSDTLGVRYQTGPWGVSLSSTHQSRQFSDNANTITETADASRGEIPGLRTWNTQVSWKVPGAKGFDVFAGINNLTDKRYYTRNVDSNAGRMVGAPRMVYVQGRYAF